jgi:hypothetical protein
MDDPARLREQLLERFPTPGGLPRCLCDGLLARSP